MARLKTTKENIITTTPLQTTLNINKHTHKSQPLLQLPFLIHSPYLSLFLSLSLHKIFHKKSKPKTQKENPLSNLPMITVALAVRSPSSVVTVQMYTPLSDASANVMRSISMLRPPLSNRPLSIGIGWPSSRDQLYSTLGSLLVWLHRRTTLLPGELPWRSGVTTATASVKHQPTYISNRLSNFLNNNKLNRKTNHTQTHNDQKNKTET